MIFETEAEDVKAAVEKAAACGANLSGANLSGADLSGANLYGANLYGVNLCGANLSGVNLCGANLSGANLYVSDLSGADLYLRLLTTPLLMLHDQVGKIRAYKLVDGDGRSPIRCSGKLKYEKGKTIEVKKADCNEGRRCAAGINVATLDWCMKGWRPGWRILVVEFTAKDIAVIPTATDGKFRLHRGKVVGEKDLKEIGLVEKEAVEA